jgi:hypothetical protein
VVKVRFNPNAQGGWVKEMDCCGEEELDISGMGWIGVEHRDMNGMKNSD